MERSIGLGCGVIESVPHFFVVLPITMKLEDTEWKLQDEKFVPLDFVIQKIIDVHSNAWDLLSCLLRFGPQMQQIRLRQINNLQLKRVLQ